MPGILCNFDVTRSCFREDTKTSINFALILFHVRLSRNRINFDYVFLFLGKKDRLLYIRASNIRVYNIKLSVPTIYYSVPTQYLLFSIMTLIYYLR